MNAWLGGLLSGLGRYTLALMGYWTRCCRGVRLNRRKLRLGRCHRRLLRGCGCARNGLRCRTGSATDLGCTCLIPGGRNSTTDRVGGWTLNPRLQMRNGSGICAVTAWCSLFGVLMLRLGRAKLFLLLVELLHELGTFVYGSVALRDFAVEGLDLLRRQRIASLLSLLGLSLKLGLLLFRNLESLKGLSQPRLCLAQPNLGWLCTFGHGWRVVEMLFVHFSLNLG